MFEENFPLKQISHYKIGGNARYFFEAENAEKIEKAILKAREIKTPIFILAGASNILINDEGFDGLILKPDILFIEKNNDLIRVGAGVSISQLLNELASHNLSGLEWAAGIPGTLGGAVYGNAGAFGREMKDIIENIVSFDISKKIPKIIKRKNNECDFKYRSSVFKQNPGREIIIEAVLKLKNGNSQNIGEEINRNLNYRFHKHPLEYPSLGSTFSNVPLTQIDNDAAVNFERAIKTDPFPVIPAAYLIAEAGLKGVSFGGAMISSKHPNFIVNVLDATAEDVKNLIQLAKDEVKNKFNIQLKEEIEYLT